MKLPKGKQKSPGRPTSRRRNQPPTPGGREKVTQINVCIANEQMRDKHKNSSLFPKQGDQTLLHCVCNKTISFLNI